MFSTANIKAGIKVYEASNGFYVEDLWAKQGKVRGIGDGVDMFSSEDEESVSVGSEEFYKLLKEWVRDSGDEIREAYFGG